MLKGIHMEEAAKQLLDTLMSLNSLKCQKFLEQLEGKIFDYLRFLPGSTTTENDSMLTEHEGKVDEVLYGKIVTCLLPIFDENFPFIGKTLNTHVENLIIVKGMNFPMFSELLLSFSEFLKTSKNEKSIEMTILLVEKVLESESLCSAIISACKEENMSEVEKVEYERNFKKFLQLLISLPSQVYNTLKKKNISETFSLHNYSKIISFHLIRGITFLNKRLFEQNIPFQIKRISTILSKIVFNWKGECLTDLVEVFIIWSLENEEGMNSTIKDILFNVERLSIEPLAVALFKRIENPNNVEKIFGCVINNENWKFILVTKIPLLSYYKSDRLITNYVFYLASKDSQHILTELLIKLLDIWGNRSALNHTSLDQHEFITKIILLAVKKLMGALQPLEKDSIRKLLFAGSCAHLESMQVELRAIGMVTGELIIDCLSETDAPKLKYEYDSMPESGKNIVKKFQRFWNKENYDCQTSLRANVSSADFIENLKTEVSILFGAEEQKKNSKKSTEGIGIEVGENEITIDNKYQNLTYKGEATSKSKKKEDITDKNTIIDKAEILKGDDYEDDNNSLDSDDDLIPYDMSNDTEKSKVQQPMYLRDLKENLINLKSNVDPDVFSETLRCSESLILSQLPHDDTSIALELLLIFSKLTEISCVENFNLLKFRACVAITTIRPKESAEYLCQEFHAKPGTHSVNDRLFFLNVLGEAAKKLSNITLIDEKIEEEEEEENAKSLKTETKKIVSKPISLNINLGIGRTHETLYDDDFEVPNYTERELQFQQIKNWEIIAQRIKTKTKVFAHSTKYPQTSINKFNDVASYFFYPLLYGASEKSIHIFNIPKYFEDQANFLLMNFLRTLSTIMVAAENCVKAPRMAEHMLELAWNLRYHEEAGVRLRTIESIAAVIVAVSKENFSNEIINLLLEMRMWLEDVSQETVMGDCNAKCREVGRVVGSLIDSVLMPPTNSS